MTAGRRHVGLLIASDAGGGVQRMTEHLADGLHNKNCRVDVIIVRPESGPLLTRLPDGVDLVKLGGNLPLMGRWSAFRADSKGAPSLALPVLLPIGTSAGIRRLPQLIRYLRKAEPDVLVSAETHTNLAALLARRRAGVGTRIVVSERGDNAGKMAASKRWRWRHVAPLMRRLYPLADGIVTVSDDLRISLSDYAGIDRHKVTTIHNPVISSDFSQAIKVPVDHPWFQKDALPVVLAAGRLEQRKGFDTLIRAFARAVADRDLRLVILGEGDERKRLEQLARELGLADKIWLPGWRSDGPAFMARSSVFVLSSVAEGFGNVLPEALASGCPVVSTDCPSGPGEILDRGRYGRLVPVGDHEAMAKALLATLDQPMPSDVLRARGEEFSVDRAVERYIALFDRICDERAAHT